MNRTNLAALAKLLRELTDPSLFGMKTFLSNADEPWQQLEPGTKEVNTCGTVACAVGHATRLFPPMRREGWWSYSERVFGLDPDSVEWDWCFNSGWEDVDDTPAGAATRIQWLLDGKPIPSRSRLHEIFDEEGPIPYE